MASISVSKNALLAGIGKSYSDDEMTDVLFDFGLELDEISVEDNEVQYKIDIPANRYDLLCLKGLIYGLRSYIDCVPGKTLESKKTVESVDGVRPEARPYIKMAILKGVNLENGGYSDLINFQDKLHQGLGQNRRLMAIGTHDYDKTTRPYTYTEMHEDEIKFTPLSQSREYTRKELDDLYKTDSKLKDYLNLARKNGMVPVVLDSKKNILSLPPLINSELSKITEKTKNIFIEITGTDLGRVSTAMDLLLHHFSEDTTEIEEILIDNGSEYQEETKKIRITPEIIKKELTLDLTLDTVQTYMKRMMHQVEINSSQTESDWSVDVIPTKLRPDILHQCDIIEDIAIAHGYNNFARTLGNNYTIGKELPINKLAQSLREECARVDYTELFTMALLSTEDYFGFGVDRHIKVKNPKSTECEVLRQHLIPSVLKCLISNQHYQLPIKVFEVSDVGEFTDSDVGVKNSKRLCMGICGRTSSLELLQESFDVVMKRQGFTVEYRNNDSTPFVKGRSCQVLYKGNEIGYLGVLDLNIHVHHKMPYVCSFVEICLNKLIE
ncbi:phenylalanyl-tRNA synthetase beta chain [Nematocida sp. ERTm5]|nr:phenylalanyl-tRNA synthetase beta chain [Nematocida sp. ERTm5]